MITAQPRLARRDLGFTLIEVAVALAVFALGAAVIYQSIGWSLARNAILIQEEHAWLKAQSLLAEVRSRIDRSPQSFRGADAQGMQWDIEIGRVTDSSASSTLVPISIEVTVRWGDRAGERVALKTIELARVGT